MQNAQRAAGILRSCLRQRQGTAGCGSRAALARNRVAPTDLHPIDRCGELGKRSQLDRLADSSSQRRKRGSGRGWAEHRSGRQRMIPRVRRCLGRRFLAMGPAGQATRQWPGDGCELARHAGRGPVGRTRIFPLHRETLVATRLRRSGRGRFAVGQDGANRSTTHEMVGNRRSGHRAAACKRAEARSQQDRFSQGGPGLHGYRSLPKAAPAVSMTGVSSDR